MGFTPQRTVYKLRFEDPAMAGLVVRMLGPTVGETIEVSRLQQGTDPEPLYRFVASKLVEWNVTDDQDAPVPATYEGLLLHEAAFVNAVILAWMTEVAGVGDPLAPSSPGGAPSAVASLPMEPLPASRAS